MITSRNDCGDFIIATPTKCATTTMESIAKRHMRNAGIDADQFRIMDWDSPRRQHRMALPPTVRDHALSDEVEIHDDVADVNMYQDGDDDEWGAADRFLAVRNPFTRYISVYRYLRAPQNYSQWGAREVQGNDWGGHDPDKVVNRDPMEFGEFLCWLSAQREADDARPPFTAGAAYRSPWVWTDSLTMSLDFLCSQPGPSAGEVSLLRMDRGELGKSLVLLKEEYGLEALNVSEVNSNRSTWGADGDSMVAQWWADAGVCSGVKDILVGTGVAGLGRRSRFRPVCGGCPGCMIGVDAETVALGYLA